MPLFALPGVGGNVLVFARLARLLGASQPVYGLQPPGFDGVEAPCTDIVELGRRQLGLIRSVRPRGPYLLAGACTGGVVAWEIARQLRAAGESVALVVLDSWHPDSYEDRALAPQWMLALGYGRLRIAAAWDDVRARPPAERPAALIGKIRRFAAAALRRLIRGIDVRHADAGSAPAFEPETGWLDRSTRLATRMHEMPGSLEEFRLTKATRHAVARYRLERAEVAVLNVIAAKRSIAPGTLDSRRYWTRLTDGPSEEVALEAEDSGRLFVPPHVEALAPVMRAFLDRYGRSPVRPA
jgi:thioesterase domain-containing protein